MTHEAGVVEKDRVDVQIQRDRKLKKGGKVTIKLCIQAENKEGTTKDEEALREASGRELSEVCPSSFFSYRFFHVG